MRARGRGVQEDWGCSDVPRLPPQGLSLEVQPPHHLPLQSGTVGRHQRSHCGILPPSVSWWPSVPTAFIIKCKLNLDPVSSCTKLLLWCILGVVSRIVFFLQVIGGGRGGDGDHTVVPVSVLLQGVQDVLGIGVHQVCPSLPQWMDDVVNEANLPKTLQSQNYNGKHKDTFVFVCNNLLSNDPCYFWITIQLFFWALLYIFFVILAQ